MKNKLNIVLFILIFALAAYFRFVGLNWDQNQHLHPDERFLTMVAGSMVWPKNLTGYFDTAKSSLNPHNLGYDFFVYGTYPVIFVKWVAEIFGMGDYNGITIVGRFMSAVFDMGTLILVFLITKLICKNKNSALFAAFVYAVMWLPIQLSHFFAVDTYLTFFLTLSFYFLLLLINFSKKIFSIGLGLSFGLAISAKISALLFFPVIGIGFIILLVKQKKFTQILSFGLLFSLFTFISVKLFYPYLFTSVSLFSELNSKVLNNWQSLKAFDGINTTFPPALQWIATKPVIFAAVNNFFWGLGIPIGIICLISLIVTTIQLFKKRFRITMNHLSMNYELALLLIWIILLFGYQSLQFAKALRYFYLTYPFLAVVSGISIYRIKNKYPKLFSIGHLSFSIILAIWSAFAFTAIYRTPHPRVTASEWIYQNIPTGSILTMEIWDDGLPLPIGNNYSGVYQTISLPLYDPDSPSKWQKLSQDLSQVNYIILTSNRLWRSLSALPDRYPQTANYYAKLFDGELGFTQIASFASYPCLIPNLSHLSNLGDLSDLQNTNLRPPSFSFTQTSSCLLALNDDGAEESFTVYDHPKVIIFQNTGKFTTELIYKLIYE